MANGVITWNGMDSDALGIIVRKVPSLNRPRRKYNSYSAPGRNGNIVVMEDAYEEYEQDYEIFMLDDAQADARTIADWLFQDGYCKLEDDWEPEYYRLAYFVGPLDVETILEEAAMCTVTFRCRPERFLVRRPIEVADGDIVENPTNHVAKPIITLTGGEIVPSILDLEKPYNISLDSSLPNWNADWLTNTFFVYNSMSTDWTGTTKMYFRTYRTAGASQEGGVLTTHVNSTGTLKFTPFRYGSQNVGIGRGIVLTPDTDYTLSFTANTGPKIVVCFFEMDGSKTYNSLREFQSNGGAHSFKFHVPATCANTLIIFYSPNNVTITFSSIMLASGTEALPFVPYGGGSTETFTINDITLSFITSGFTTATIDCEREDFTVDGANANASASILDQYGNLSPTFLQLDKGENVIDYSENISSVTIEPRFWEL